MRSRLAFGLSMAFEFDYYLIDEVMAVGDAQFRQKCREAFRERLSDAQLILVSHNMADIREWCDVVVMVKDGTATLYEDVEAGIAAYTGPMPPEVLRKVRRAERESARQAAAAAGAGRRPGAIEPAMAELRRARSHESAAAAASAPSSSCC